MSPGRQSCLGPSAKGTRKAESPGCGQKVLTGTPGGPRGPPGPGSPCSPRSPGSPCGERRREEHRAAGQPPPPAAPEGGSMAGMVAPCWGQSHCAARDHRARDRTLVPCKCNGASEGTTQSCPLQRYLHPGQGPPASPGPPADKEEVRVGTPPPCHRLPMSILSPEQRVSGWVSPLSLSPVHSAAPPAAPRGDCAPPVPDHAHPRPHRARRPRFAF